MVHIVFCQDYLCKYNSHDPEGYCTRSILNIWDNQTISYCADREANERK